MTVRILVLEDVAGRTQLAAGLEALDNGWIIQFADSPSQALQTMGMIRFDAVVACHALAAGSDPHLMERVQKRHPGAIRILLHEKARGDLDLRCFGLAHQTLAKPCVPAQLDDAIRRALRLRDVFLTRDSHRMIANIEALPTPPPAHRALVREFQKSEPSVDEVVRIMSRDLGLTAKVLQLVNSAYFGLPTEVRNLKHAVTLLGLDLVRNLALASGVFNSMEVRGLGYITPDWLADHGTVVGRRARQIALDLGLERHLGDSALLAGLLHDCGKLIQLGFSRTQLQAAGKRAIEEGLPLHLAERARFGLDHSRLGAHLLALWGFPYRLVEAVAFHHDPLQAGDPQRSILAALHIADALIWERYRDRPQPYRPTGGRLDPLYLEAIGLGESSLEAWRAVDLVSGR